jgi:crotonobetainyl-CoA:carnitine CoA-transferase CaiB-like acyl-CoA transferase
MILSGIRVIDVSRVLAGPFCGQLLADMGADVIKIESPAGDENRLWPPIMPNGQSSNYASVNRGKRAMTLDMKTDGGREVLTRLIAWADVVTHSFLPDVAARLGLTWENVRAVNPRVVFCSISGYGEHGELRNKGGYDLMVQAFSGAMSTTGYEGGPPVRTGVSFIDMATGMSAYAAIVSALYAREKTGEGTWVRASLLETSVALLGYHAVGWMQAGIMPKKQGSGSASQTPYQAFATSDGFVLAGAPNNAAWQRMCAALGDEALAKDERFSTNQARFDNRDVLIPLLETHFRTRSAAHWVKLFETHGVASAPIQTLDQVLTHPQVLANDMVVHATGKDGVSEPLVGTPFKIEGARQTGATAAPTLGAHTDAILREILGYSAADVAAFKQAGIV